jgi:signal transduction histidine kinase
MLDILIIDDNEDVRESLAGCVQRFGHQVRAAPSGDMGLWMLAERPANLVIADIRMPVVSGLEVLQIVRNRWPGTEVVLVTGYGSVEEAVEALRLGAYDFLLKPISIPHLESVVGRCDERLQFAKDNRELRAVVDRLRELNERRKKFIALASHEIRTPVAAIVGLTAVLNRLIGEKMPQDLDLRHLALRFDETADRLKEIVADLEELGLADRKELALRPSTHTLGELTDAVDNVCQTYRDTRALNIRVQCPGNRETELRIDHRKLLRGVAALVQNAVKYTPDGGEVLVRVFEEGGEIALEVGDTGIGVPEEEREKIFDTFYEVADPKYHSSSGHEFGGGGLGVGLPLARTIAHAHGGDVFYRPHPTKEGSIFTLRIPAAGLAHPPVPNCQ